MNRSTNRSLKRSHNNEQRRLTNYEVSTHPERDVQALLRRLCLPAGPGFCEKRHGAVLCGRKAQPSRRHALHDEGGRESYRRRCDLAHPLRPFRRRGSGSAGQGARHGTSPEVLADMGEASGIVFSAAGEPTVYWAGDTLWYEAVKHAIDVFMPEVIIVHAGGALWNGELIVMDAAQVIEVCKAAPNAKVIAIHMESCDHCTVTRKSLRETADAAGVSPEQLLIPKDGEEIVILQETAF